MRGSAWTLSILLIILAAGCVSPLALAQSQPSPTSVGTLNMKVAVVPTEIPADGGTYSSLFVQLATPKGQVVAAPQSYQVYLTSANVSVASVQSLLVIQKGQTYGVATITSSTQPGSTNITLAATGLAPASVIVTTYALGGAPYKLVSFVAPTILFSDGASTYYFFVEALDSTGLPAVASAAMNLAVTSSAPAVATLPPSVTIQASSSVGMLQFKAGAVNGSTTITAQLNDIYSSSILVKSGYFPLSVTLTAPATGSLTAGSSVDLSVTALSSGIPVSAASVNWTTSSAADVFTNGSLTTDQKGVAPVTLRLGAGGNVTVTAAVSAVGYGTKSASILLSVVARTLTVTLIAESLQVNASQTSGVTAIVTSSGKPVAGAQVSWSASIGAVSPQASTTDATGTAATSFVSPANGNATIIASVAAPGYSAGSGSTTITVGAISTTGGGGGGFLSFIPGPNLFGIPLLLVVVVVIVVIGVVMLRRRGAKAPEETEEVAPEPTTQGADEE